MTCPVDFYFLNGCEDCIVAERLQEETYMRVCLAWRPTLSSGSFAPKVERVTGLRGTTQPHNVHTTIRCVVRRDQ